MTAAASAPISNHDPASVRPLRVGIDAHVVTGKYQGTRTTLTNLLRALARQKTRHHIVVYVDDVPAAQAIIGPSDFEFRDLGSPCGPVRRLLFRFPRFLKRDRIDAAIFQYNAPLAGRAKRILFVHDILPITHARFFPLRNRIRIGLFFTISIWRAARIVTVSDHGYRSVADLYRLPPSKMSRVPNGPSFDRSVYDEPRVPAAAPYILTVGRIEQRKNIALLASAFLRASPAGVRLVIVGSPDLGYDYRLPDDPRIENLRHVDDAALIDLYRGASLFVYPSAAEGFGIPLLDALLFGVPVIASDQTAMPEIADGLAQMFDPTRPDAESRLAAAIAGHFADRPVPAPTMAQRDALYDRYNWDAAATRLLRVVDDIAGPPA
jgi:glycosyltransferase involved in cell wall biosynthesis